MNVTRNVIEDLLTVYLAGEASEDTRALVEQWMARDPELARKVERARLDPLPIASVPTPTPEKSALDRSRRRLRTRVIVFGAAVYFTTLPLAVSFDRSGFRGLLIEEWAERAAVLAVAAALWLIYFYLRSHWRGATRERSHGV